MVDFVCKHARENPLTFNDPFSALQILPRNDHTLRPMNLGSKLRNAQTSLFLILVSFGIDQLWICQNDKRVRLFAHSHVDHDQSFQYPQLGGSQTVPWR